DAAADRRDACAARAAGAAGSAGTAGTADARVTQTADAARQTDAGVARRPCRAGSTGDGVRGGTADRNRQHGAAVAPGPAGGDDRRVVVGGTGVTRASGDVGLGAAVGRAAG